MTSCNKPVSIADVTSGSIEARLLAVSDTEFDHLQSENISTILSYGDTFMDLLCRDACDGLDVGRVGDISVKGFPSSFSCFVECQTRSQGHGCSLWAWLLMFFEANSALYICFK